MLFICSVHSAPITQMLASWRRSSRLRDPRANTPATLRASLGSRTSVCARSTGGSTRRPAASPFLQSGFHCPARPSRKNSAAASRPPASFGSVTYIRTLPPPARGRPTNNRHLDWEEITLDASTVRGTFKLNRHKNVNKGIKARGCLARELVLYLLSIRPANASGPIHVNPETGKPYVDLRKQWKRLLDIAGQILGYKLKGKKAKFLNFRHTGASDVAKLGRDGHHLLRVVRMMGDTSLATVNRHYFNLDDDAMQEIIDGWQIPDADVFAPDLPPLCEEQEPAERAGSSVAA